LHPRGGKRRRAEIGRRLGLAALLLLPGACGGAPGEPANRATPADLRIAPGLWERRSVIVDARGPNLPIEARQRLIGPRPAARFCVGEGAPTAAMVAGRACAYRTFSLEGGRLRGNMVCSDEGGPSTAIVDGRYGPGGYDLRIEMANRLPDGAVLTLDVRTSGRRIGPCPQAAQEERK
jgi:hypothetical protein